MFHYDGGLKINAIDLAVDVQRRQRQCFVSHAHGDHMARHQLAWCTPETAALYQHRLGPRLVRTMQRHQAYPLQSARLTAVPAGHMLGSAMLLVELEQQRLLYTGDFCLDSLRTARSAAPIPADVLIMESTFGNPAIRRPPRQETESRLLDYVRQARAAGKSPVIYGYATGKLQEVCRLLCDRGERPWLHPAAYAIAQVYEQCNCPLGDYREYQDDSWSAAETDREPILLPPPFQKSRPMRLPPRRSAVALTGWACNQSTRFKWQSDSVLPLSDHADFQQLLQLITRVSPRVVYCTHGNESFVDQLRLRGHQAHWLATSRFPSAVGGRDLPV